MEGQLLEGDCNNYKTGMVNGSKPLLGFTMKNRLRDMGYLKKGESDSFESHQKALLDSINKTYEGDDPSEKLAEYERWGLKLLSHVEQTSAPLTRKQKRAAAQAEKEEHLKFLVPRLKTYWHQIRTEELKKKSQEWIDQAPEKARNRKLSQSQPAVALSFPPKSPKTLPPRDFSALLTSPTQPWNARQSQHQALRSSPLPGSEPFQLEKAQQLGVIYQGSEVNEQWFTNALRANYVYYRRFNNDQNFYLAVNPGGNRCGEQGEGSNVDFIFKTPDQGVHKNDRLRELLQNVKGDGRLRRASEMNDHLASFLGLSRNTVPQKTQITQKLSRLGKPSVDLTDSTEVTGPQPKNVSVPTWAIKPQNPKPAPSTKTGKQTFTRRTPAAPIDSTDAWTSDSIHPQSSQPRSERRVLPRQSQFKSTARSTAIIRSSKDGVPVVNPVVSSNASRSITPFPVPLQRRNLNNEPVTQRSTDGNVLKAELAKLSTEVRQTPPPAEVPDSVPRAVIPTVPTWNIMPSVPPPKQVVDKNIAKFSLKIPKPPSDILTPQPKPGHSSGSTVKENKTWADEDDDQEWQPTFPEGWGK